MNYFTFSFRYNKKLNMKISGRPIWTEINLEAIYNNLIEIKRLADNKKIISVIKDDAYGHGASQVLKRIEPFSDFFGCACVKEALTLKKSTRKPFIIFGGVFDNEIKYLDKQIIPVVYDFDSLYKLVHSKVALYINIEIDTGMGRTGFLPEQIDDLIKLLKRAPKIKLFGIMSHFASSDCNESYTYSQIKRFDEAVKLFMDKGFNPEIIHIANSAGIFYDIKEPINAIRPGIMLYGGYPDKRFRDKIKLTPAMSFKTKIISLKKVPKDALISYGGTFKTKRESQIATLSVGYGDGYFRSLSNKGIVYIKDKGLAPVCGRVCMDMTMVDVTDLKDVKRGDEVILWGSEKEEIHPDNIADLAGTISYELFCAVSKRVKRFYKGIE